MALPSVLLREAMKGILPEETRTRIKKTGWNAPAHVWFSGPSLEQLLDLVGSRAFRERGVYNVPVVEKIIAEHRNIVASSAQQENHMMFLWQLVNVELWYREVVSASGELRVEVSVLLTECRHLGARLSRGVGR